MASRVTHRAVAKNKKNGTSAEFATIWENERGMKNISFVTAEKAAASGGKLIEGLMVVGNPGDYFMNFYENKPRIPEGADTASDEF